MKTFTTLSKVAKHTNLIGTGYDFNNPVTDRDEAMKVLKDTAGVFNRSDCYEIFSKVKMSDNPVELLNGYLFALKEYNSESDRLEYYIKKEKSNYNVVVSLGADYADLYYLSLDWIFLIENKYPYMKEIIDDILYVLDNTYGYEYCNGYYSDTDMLAEQLNERVYNDDYHDAKEKKMLKKVLNHYEGSREYIGNIFFDRSVNDIPTIKSIKDRAEHIPKSKSVKFNALKEWIYHVVQFMNKHDGSYGVDYFHKLSLDEFEAVQGVSFEEHCESADMTPITINDMYSMTWFGDEYTSSEIVEYINMLKGEAGSVDLSRYYTVRPTETIPFDIIGSDENTFLKDLGNLVVEFNQIKHLFVTKKYNFLL